MSYIEKRTERIARAIAEEFGVSKPDPGDLERARSMLDRELKESFKNGAFAERRGNGQSDKRHQSGSR